MTRKNRFTVLLALGMVFAPVASAETVLISRGDDSFGQGWLFLDASGTCRIATPRHVVEREDGSLSSPDLLDSFGRLHPTGRAVTAVDETLDLAFLTVRGAIARQGCSTDRIRSTPLQPVIDSIKQATLEISTLTERQSLLVALRAVSRDAEGGKIIAVSPLDASTTFQKGMSGGTVMHNGRPLAMLFEVDPEQGIGIALRYDIIAAELDKTEPPEPELPDSHRSDGKTPNDSLVIQAGRVAEKDTSLGSFLNGEAPLHLAPVGGRVSLLVDLDEATKISRIRLAGMVTGADAAVIVEADNDGQGFVPGARCALADETTCIMSPRRVTRLRVSLTGMAGSAYVVEKLELFSR